jgi:growth differentiation factor 8/11
LHLHGSQGNILQLKNFLEEDKYHATTEMATSMTQETDSAVQTNVSPLCCHYHFSPKVKFTEVLEAQPWM